LTVDRSILNKNLNFYFCIVPFGEDMLTPRGGRGLDSRKLQAAMRNIKMEEIDDVEEVVIYTKGKEYHFANAKVQATNMQGQSIYYILGEPTVTDRKKTEKKEEKPKKYTKEDIELVMMQAGVSEEEAIKALEETDGQPAEAILKLMK